MRNGIIIIFLALSISITSEANIGFPGYDFGLNLMLEEPAAVIDSHPPARAHHALVYDARNKRVLMTSGSTPLDGGNSFAFYNDLWAFDGNSWKNLGEAGDERSGIRLAYNPTLGEIFSFGGFSSQNQTLSDLRVLSGASWKESANDPKMQAAEPGFVYDIKRNKFIAFGGSPGRGRVHNTTWEWDGMSWKDLGIPGPKGRQAFAMVYDSKRNTTVLFGGMGTTPNDTYGDTWEFDGKKWTLVDSTGPSPRISPGFTYDASRGLFVIFGGAGPSGMLGDTWGWDGSKWSQLSLTGPAARGMGYLAYDSHRDKIVLFGGRLRWPNDASDTWEWDGKEWREVR